METGVQVVGVAGRDWPYSTPAEQNICELQITVGLGYPKEEIPRTPRTFAGAFYYYSLNHSICIACYGVTSPNKSTSHVEEPEL